MHAALFVVLIWIMPSGAAAGTALEKTAAVDLLVARTRNEAPAADPWRRLQSLYLPFTWQMEQQALKSKDAAQRVRQGFHQRLSPYRDLIEAAARRFDIPKAVIGAVIMVESAGNARAKAKTSSAKGLMQTIDSTFRMARKGLDQEGIQVAESPYDPRASIMTGCWYLNRMYDRVLTDRQIRNRERSQVGAWKEALEYYYAGPYHGRSKAPVVITYAGGRKVVINKQAYSLKVLRWADMMQISGLFG